MFRRPIPVCLTLILLTALCGCGASSSVENGVTTYTFTPVFPIILAAAGIALLAGGVITLILALREAGSKPLFQILAAVAGVILLFGAVPGSLMSRVSVSDTQLSINCGAMWFGRDIADIDLRHLNSIETEERERWSRRGRRVETWYTFSLDNGTTLSMKGNALLDAGVEHAGRLIEDEAWNLRQESNAQAGTSPSTSPPATSPAAMSDPTNPADPPHPAAIPEVPDASELALIWPDLRTPLTGSTSTDASSQFFSGDAAQPPAADGVLVPDSTAPATAELHAGADWPPGTKVMVQLGNQKIPGVITESIGGGRYRVEVVRNGRTVPMVMSAERMQVATADNSNPATPNGSSTVAAEDIAVGSKLQALWGSQWYDVTITQVISPDLFRVHYDGYSDNFDENVSRSRLRDRP